MFLVKTKHLIQLLLRAERPDVIVTNGNKVSRVYFCIKAGGEKVANCEARGMG